MAVKEPESMEELIYFTRRTLEPKGAVRAWVYKQPCPKCKKATMGKPVEGGKVKVRAKEYACPACGYTAEKQAYEDTLVCEAAYTCPRCGKPGESTAPFKRKNVEGVPAIQLLCQHCQGKINITKKLRQGKKKAAAQDDDDF